ncbi:MAG: hypothetical protein WCO56_27645 [Verrucomicrobiota bacterium]
MAGYLVLPEEACDWSGAQPGKVRPNPVRLGITDLVRQFEQDPFPFTRRSSGICLFGLDEFLAQMEQLEDVNDSRDWPFLQEMRRRLRAVSNEVSNIGVIHVPIRHSLLLGADKHLFARYAGKRIPLWRLFGSNPTIGCEAGQETYLYGENLS